MPNKKISDLAAASALDGTELMEVVQGGTNKQSTTGAIGNVYWRGDFNPTGNVLPSTGGTGASGVPGAGDEWILTGALTLGGNDYSTGTIVKAKVSTPGQTLTNWAFIATQV